MTSTRYEAARQIYSVLVMHFVEGMKQAEIAEADQALPRQGQPPDQAGPRDGHGRDRHPQPLPGAVRSRGALQGSDRPRNGSHHADAPRSIPQTILQQVGAAAASLLLETLQDGDIDLHHRRQGRERRGREC